MNTVKEKDFIEISYIGRIKDSNQIFDLTDKDLAKKENIFNENEDYNPKIICIGESQILKAIDDTLIGKDIGKTYTLELSPEKAFGKKDSSLIKVVQTSVLQQQKINPFPGLQINASGLLGTIRAVNSGRTTIDFNHPLAGRNIIYEIKINRIVTELKEKISSLVKNLIGIHDKEFTLVLEGNNAEIKLNLKIPSEIKEGFIKKVKNILSDVNFSFV